MIEIPEQLKQKGINFLIVGPKSKKPIQKEWQSKIMEFDNLELQDALQQGYNYGVRGGGEKNLLIVDFDNFKIQNIVMDDLPKTFVVKTGSGMLHMYFFTTINPESYKAFDEEMNTLFDVQGEGKQVIGPGSVHPNGNTYEVINNMPISFIDYAELKAKLMAFDRRPKKKTPEIQNTQTEQRKELSKIAGGDFLDKIKNVVSMARALEYCGIDTTKNPTSCPFHSSKGGHCLGFSDKTAHCFHCIHPNQDVFTISGLKNISEIKEGDITINANGERVKIVKITKHNFSGKMLSIYIKGNNQPLQVTDNHGMYYYKDVNCNANYLSGTSVCNLLCKNKLKGRCALWKNKNFNIVGKIDAKELTTRDALFIPIPNIEKDLEYLDVSHLTTHHNLGPRRTKIHKLPLTNEMLWVIGFYLAEGNPFRGGIKFSLHPKEREFANKVLTTFKQINITGSTFNQTTKTGSSLLVHICNTDLSEIFPKLFGSGCQNKRVPRELLDLPKVKCEHLLQGILDGDASKKYGTLSQTSKQLMMDSYELALKIGRFPSMGIRKKVENRKQVYEMNPLKIGMQRIKVNNHMLLPVLKIESKKYNGDVYDITVDSDHHSLLTPQGMIGNCEGSWNVFSLIKEYKKYSFKEALDVLAGMAGMKDELIESKKKYIDTMKKLEAEALTKKVEEEKARLAPKRSTKINVPGDDHTYIAVDGNIKDPVKDMIINRMNRLKITRGTTLGKEDDSYKIKLLERAAAAASEKKTTYTVEEKENDNA